MGEYSLPEQESATTHARSTYNTWANVQRHLRQPQVVLDGESLEVSHLVSVAKYGSKPVLQKTPQFIARIERSVEMLQRHLDRGDMIYGVLILCHRYVI